jgi:hypothetical protein
MLRLAFTGALAAMLLVGVRPASADDVEKDAKAIIVKAIEAQGGAANLEKYKASSVKTKGKFYGFGLNADTTGTIQAMEPDKLRLESKSKADGADFVFLMVVNGDKGWMVFGGNNTELDKEMMAETREQLYAGQVSDLRGLTDKGVKLTSTGATKIGDKSAVGVKVSCKGHRDVNLFFDKDTNLLLKSETRATEPSSGEVNVETLYSDYKKVNGRMVAHKVIVKHDGKPYSDAEVTEVKLTESLPDSTFAKP